MKGFCLEVSGPWACFTRPEMKVERVRYDVMTPSAARAIFEAILWKPQIAWRILRIDVLMPIRWVSIRRNEVGGRASPDKRAIFIEDDRQQRASLALRDVRYRIHGAFDLIPPERRPGTRFPVPGVLEGAEDIQSGQETPAKYAAMFERRARRGQCFTQPYLGCREFAAEFRLVDPKSTAPLPIPESRDLGWMLYDLDFSDPKEPKPFFFRARMEDGSVDTDLERIEVRR